MRPFAWGSARLPEHPASIVSCGGDEGVLGSSSLVDQGHVPQHGYSAIGVARPHLDLRVRKRVRDAVVRALLSHLVHPSRQHLTVCGVLAYDDEFDAESGSACQSTDRPDEHVSVVASALSPHMDACELFGDRLQAFVRLIVASGHRSPYGLLRALLRTCKPLFHDKEWGGVRVRAPGARVYHLLELAAR